MTSTNFQALASQHGDRADEAEHRADNSGSDCEEFSHRAAFRFHVEPANEEEAKPKPWWVVSTDEGLGQVQVSVHVTRQAAEEAARARLDQLGGLGERCYEEEDERVVFRAYSRHGNLSDDNPVLVEVHAPGEEGAAS